MSYLLNVLCHMVFTPVIVVCNSVYESPLIKVALVLSNYFGAFIYLNLYYNSHNSNIALIDLSVKSNAVSNFW